jgi:hypothetical protein
MLWHIKYFFIGRFYIYLGCFLVCWIFISVKAHLWHHKIMLFSSIHFSWEMQYKYVCIFICMYICQARHANLIFPKFFFKVHMKIICIFKIFIFSLLLHYIDCLHCIGLWWLHIQNQRDGGGTMFPQNSGI